MLATVLLAVLFVVGFCLLTFLGFKWTRKPVDAFARADAAQQGRPYDAREAADNVFREISKLGPPPN